MGLPNTARPGTAAASGGSQNSDRLSGKIDPADKTIAPDPRDADDLEIPDFLDRRQAPSRGIEEWAEKIAASWKETAAGIIRTGQLLNEAKVVLHHGEWQKLKLPFSRRTAQMLMEIARNPALVKAQNSAHLPPHWTTLHEIAQRPAEEIEADIATGAIHPGMTRFVNNDKWREKHRKFTRLKRIRPASPPKKAAKITPQGTPARGAPARRPLLPPTAANDLLETAVRLSADLGAWPGDILAVVRLMPIEDRRKLGELADKIVNWWLRVHDAATPNKELEI